MFRRVDNSIEFYHPVSDIFDKVHMLSSYQGKNIVSDKGPELDRVALTEDERDVFGEFLSNAVNNISLLFVKMNTEIYVIDNTVTMKVRDNGLAKDSVLQSFDKLLKELIVETILQAWYEKISIGELFQLSTVKVQAMTIDLSNKTFHLRKIGI